MNSWNSDNYQVGMHGAVPQMMPPMFMMDNMSVTIQQPLIGPVMPDTVNLETQVVEPDNQKDVKSSQSLKKRSRSRDRSDHRRDRDKNRSRRSRSRDRNDRNRNRSRNGRRLGDRRRNDRDSSHDSRAKWDTDENETSMMMPQVMDNSAMNMGSMMMPGMMQQQMQYQNMMNMMGQQGMDVSMMGGVNMSNMMTSVDPNMMMMNQQVMGVMPNQQLNIRNGVLLPPIPGVSTPTRRERPKGCRTIFVGGLPQSMPYDIVTEIFQRFGDIQEIKSPRKGVFYVRFRAESSVEQSFTISGYRFRFLDQLDNEATTMFIDFALNRDDQIEYDKNPLKRNTSPPRVEPFSPAALTTVAEKIKSEDEFAAAAPTLTAWLERGECNKRNANSFYSLVQASNNQLLRLFNEKIKVDEEYQDLKIAVREKFCHILLQFEQVAKILTAAKHQRVSDHFTKQQRRNIDMWMKMTEELENMKEELSALFEEDDMEKTSKNAVPIEKYEELMRQNENLTYELEGYKNEAHLAKDEAERKFEKFKAHFIAQQALQNNKGYNTVLIKDEKPLPPPPLPPPPPPPAVNDDKIITSGPIVPPSEAKLISILTAFLMVHPLGASIDYLVSYVRSMTPSVTQATVLATLQKYDDVFRCKTSGIGASIEHRWSFVTFDIIKTEQ